MRKFKDVPLSDRTVDVVGFEDFGQARPSDRADGVLYSIYLMGPGGIRTSGPYSGVFSESYDTLFRSGGLLDLGLLLATNFLRAPFWIIASIASLRS